MPTTQERAHTHRHQTIAAALCRAGCLRSHTDDPYSSVSQPPGRGPVRGPGINHTGPREVLLEFVILVF